jgi:hypothetical protein
MREAIFIGKNDRKADGWMVRSRLGGKLACLNQIRN